MYIINLTDIWPQKPKDIIVLYRTLQPFYDVSSMILKT